MDILWHHKIIKLGITLCFLMIFYTSSASLVFADAIGASMTILSIHTKPWHARLKRAISSKSVPERIDEGGVGPQNGHQALYISSHQPTRGRNSVL